MCKSQLYQLASDKSLPLSWTKAWKFLKVLHSFAQILPFIEFVPIMYYATSQTPLYVLGLKSSAMCIRRG